ncbi:hypothetical protein [Streptomyces sp. XH2]|uniref:hypothetical protein n=1 Tax=Streptomyces sp. XH2 TaxID=3412483 RepID=UPI003C7D907D
MSDLVPAARNVLQKTGEIVGAAVTYTLLVAELASASAGLRFMGSLVRSTFDYVEDCARDVDQLAETAASMNVDADTVAEHHQAAQVMRSVLAEATDMAAAFEETATSFEQAKADHEADYGVVNETAQNMPVEMADREFYANR